MQRLHALCERKRRSGRESGREGGKESYRVQEWYGVSINICSKLQHCQQRERERERERVYERERHTHTQTHTHTHTQQL